ncbi:MAG: hypothetical protein HC906_18990 [Bacteroidales bacterium]|nr:hypothetical protein [Bacteroidales bacterium]
MEKTALNLLHKKYGAKMVEYAGFEMPVEYSGVSNEHNTVRNSVGLFDVSHMGEIWIKGPNALDLIQYVTTNDASRLLPGKAHYSCFPNGNGGIIDDLIVYHYSHEKYLLVVNASNTKDSTGRKNTICAEIEIQVVNSQIAVQDCA